LVEDGNPAPPKTSSSAFDAMAYMTGGILDDESFGRPNPIVFAWINAIEEERRDFALFYDALRAGKAVS
jgi:hypothetical protein